MKLYKKSSHHALQRARRMISMCIKVKSFNERHDRTQRAATTRKQVTRQRNERRKPPPNLNKIYVTKNEPTWRLCGGATKQKLYLEPGWGGGMIQVCTRELAGGGDGQVTKSRGMQPVGVYKCQGQGVWRVMRLVRGNKERVRVRECVGVSVNVVREQMLC